MSTGLVGLRGMSLSTAVEDRVVYDEEDMLLKATEGLTEEDSDNADCKINLMSLFF